MYNKINEKSIYPRRIDLFLFFASIVLVTGFAATRFIFQSKKDTGQNELFLSRRSIELLGKNSVETLIQEFQEHDPAIRIKLPAGEKEPDLIIFDEGEYSGLIRNGTLASLRPYLRAERGGTGVTPAAIPLVSYMDLLFYNIDLLKASGFDRPPKTRDEFLVHAKAVSAGKAVSGTALGLDPGDKQALSRDVFSWIWAAGGEFWPKADASRNRINRPVINNRITIDVFSFLGELNKNEILAPNTFQKTGAQRLEEFAQGKIAMLIASSRDIPSLKMKMNEDTFSVTTIPGSGHFGNPSLRLDNIYAAISINCANPDVAWKFLSFIVEQSPFLCANLQAVPGAGYGDYILSDPDYLKARDFFESSEIAQGFLGKSQAEEYEDIVMEELQIFFSLNRKAEDTVNIIQNRWDSISFRN